MTDPLDMPQRFFHQLKVVDGKMGDDPDCKCLWCEKDKEGERIRLDEVYDGE